MPWKSGKIAEENIKEQYFKSQARLAKIFKLEHRGAGFFENVLPPTATEITFKISFNLAKR